MCVVNAFPQQPRPDRRGAKSPGLSQVLLYIVEANKVFSPTDAIHQQEAGREVGEWILELI